MGTFAANRDIVINASPSSDGSGFHVRTEGLTRRGLPELEMLHVPEAQAKNAAGVLNTIADYIANQSRVEDGESVAVMAPGGALVARLEAGPTHPADGFWGKMFSKSTRVQRVCEPVDSMEYPKTLLSTIMLWRAKSLIDQDQIEEARAELLDSIGWFPGDPAKRADLCMGFRYNWENHLAYAMLAEISEEAERHGWLAKAFERSEEFERSQLGDTAEELKDLGIEGLAARARAIHAENAAPTEQMPVSSGIVMMASPLRRRLELDDGVVADRCMTIVPAMCAEYQATTALADAEELCQLVADVIAAHADSTSRLALTVDDVRRLYEGGNEEAPSFGNPSHYHTGDRLVSLFLADAARRMYAGLTLPELRASYGLLTDETARREGASKMAELVAKEGEAYVQAMSP